MRAILAELDDRHEMSEDRRQIAQFPPVSVELIRSCLDRHGRFDVEDVIILRSMIFESHGLKPIDFLPASEKS